MKEWNEAALLLVGHGSHLSGGSSAPVRDLALRLLRARAFPEVRVAFWKEEPSLRHAFDLIERRDVFVVPVFTSEGYFTEEVLPRELGMDRGGSGPRGIRVHACPPIGTHPDVARIARLRIHEVVPTGGEEERRTAVIVLGHGTSLHPRSGDSTSRLVESLRSGGRYAAVLPAFLDQPPELEGVLDAIEAPEVIVLPFFVAEGWHAGTTIPRDLALEGGEVARGGSRVRYAKPIGTHPLLGEVVLSLVRTVAVSGAPPTVGEAMALPPGAVARERFEARLTSAVAVPHTFLQVCILPDGGGRWELRHVDDADHPSDALVPARGVEAAEALAARTADGRHRPLRTAPDLRRGWRMEALDPSEVWEILAYLYPTAAAHREAAYQGELRVGSWDAVASRQTGIYSGLEQLPWRRVEGVIRETCGRDRCLRTPLWYGEVEGAPPASEEVPCPEPCSVLVSAVKRAAPAAKARG